MKTSAVVIACLAGMAIFPSCSSSNDNSSAAATPTVTASLPALGLGTLAAALAAAELEDDLAGAGPFTLFAPSDAAFAALPPGTVASLLQPQNKQQLIDILLYHVVSGNVDAATAATLDGANTLGGGGVLVDQVGSALFVNDARVTGADNRASNGIVHVVDRVLLPPQSVVDTLASRGFDTLVTAVTAAGLGGALSGVGPFTVLAPTDEAFAALGQPTLDFLLDPANQATLAGILTYHVVPGRLAAGDALTNEIAGSLQGRAVLFASPNGEARVNGATIRAVNIPCTNGVVHVIDAVLELPDPIATVATDLGFSTLVSALVATNLASTFADPAAGPFTVFAPTNAAFAALPAGLLNQLLQPVNLPVLAQILRYHVVAGNATARDVEGAIAAGLTTLQGATVGVTHAQAGLRVDGQPVSVANVLAANGIVHAIDGVLVPPGVLSQLQ